MQVGMGLNLIQTQKLIITPEFRQAIAILQLQSQELEHFIEQELMENPLLDLTDETVEDTASQEQGEDTEEKFDQDWQEYFADGSDLGYVGGGEMRPGIPFEQMVRGEANLVEDLLLQWRFSVEDPSTRARGEFLIGNLDENGYLKIALDEAAEILKCSLEEVTTVLELVQDLEPVGIGARDLRECLLLQLDKNYGEQPLARTIIENYLEDLGAGRVIKIAKELGVTPIEVQEAGDLIRSFNPKPGAGYLDTDEANNIVPDVLVRQIEGEYLVLVNEQLGPRLRINSQYSRLLSGEKQFEAKDKKFLEERLQAALWVIKSIEQRRLTLYRVVNSIINFQKDFLAEGVTKLKPLTLREVAKELEIHESTVSRAISNKYVQTPRGLFEIKYFFASGVEKYSGQSTSAESIKDKMVKLIEREDKFSPLSDRAITEELQGSGIKISRRTVAKYREELEIPTAGQRKRF
ncbi:MAG: RNA polymerase factor sigma-54 [Bacillota bacterium]